MSQLVEIECPTCGRKWWMDYAELQHYRIVYRSARDATGKGTGRSAGRSAAGTSAPQDAAGRIEEYSVRCPNPAHGEDVIVTLEVSGTDD